MTTLADKAKAALEGATPGPWTVDEESCPFWGQNFSVLQKGSMLVDVAEMVRTEEDARLIALAPDLARAYLDVLAERDRLTRALIAARSDLFEIEAGDLSTFEAIDAINTALKQDADQ